MQELAWRDYWQQVWVAKKDDINQDLKNKQSQVRNYKIPEAVLSAQTGIKAVDEAIKQLYKTGYMHNHMRMYVAAICCNIAGSHWLEPAKWLYSHLLDGDLASNHLSWQWVAGAFSNKKYYANQDNINRYFNSEQKNTFLDVPYSQFEDLEIPEILRETSIQELNLSFPDINKPRLNPNKKTLIYNYYNIDPYWYEEKDAQRIFLLEPSIFKKNPISQQCLDFALSLTKNIDNMQIFVGEFSELAQHINTENILYKEHPLNAHYQGKEESRDWLSSVTGYYPSFFAFWKKCKKELLQ